MIKLLVGDAMFDFGFWEIAIIGIITLIVVGLKLCDLSTLLVVIIGAI